MHCVSSLPSRVPSWGRAAGLGIPSRSPPSPLPGAGRPPDDAQQPWPGKVAGTRAPWLPPQPRGQPRNSRCNYCPGDLATHLFPPTPPHPPPPRGCLPRCGGSRGAAGGGTFLPPPHLKKKKIPPPNPLKTKPQALPSAMVRPSPAPSSSSIPPSPIFCWFPRATPSLGRHSELPHRKQPEPAKGGGGANACPQSWSAWDGFGEFLLHPPWAKGAGWWGALLPSQELGEGEPAYRCVCRGSSSFQLHQASQVAFIQFLGFWGEGMRLSSSLTSVFLGTSARKVVHLNVYIAG